MQTSLTKFSDMMTEQFAMLTNSVGEIQQRLVTLEENMTLSSMVSITDFNFFMLLPGIQLVAVGVWFQSRQIAQYLSGRMFGSFVKNIHFYKLPVIVKIFSTK